MTSSSNHQPWNSHSRDSQSLRNDRCQNILFKAVFEHFIDLHDIAALLLTSKSFQNSSFGANFLVNFVVEKDTILLLESVLSSSSCFSQQFVPSLHIQQSWKHSEKVNRSIANFVGEIVSSKYLHSSLQSLTLDNAFNDVVSFFFGSSTSNNAWPQLQDLGSKFCEVNDSVLEAISKNARQLRSLNLQGNPEITNAGLVSISTLSNIKSLNLEGSFRITDTGMKDISKLSGITSLELSRCDKITDVGLEHIAKLANITSLNLANCSSISDAGIQEVSKLSGITSLNLYYCTYITDAAILHVSKLSNIIALNLLGCFDITAVAVANFRIAVPNCQITG